jgi:hypothetical protein
MLTALQTLLICPADPVRSPISPILIMADPKSVLNLAGFLLYLVMLLAQAPN